MHRLTELLVLLLVMRHYMVFAVYCTVFDGDDNKALFDLTRILYQSNQTE